MSNSIRLLLSRFIEDPAAAPIAPVLRVFLGVPDETFAHLLRLADLWTKLKPVRRALLIQTLIDNLKVGEVARLAGVHRCTLSKNRAFRQLRNGIRTGRLGAIPRGHKSAAGDIDSVVDGDFDDQAADARY